MYDPCACLAPPAAAAAAGAADPQHDCLLLRAAHLNQLYLTGASSAVGP